MRIRIWLLGSLVCQTDFLYLVPNLAAFDWTQFFSILPESLVFHQVYCFMIVSLCQLSCSRMQPFILRSFGTTVTFQRINQRWHRVIATLILKADHQIQRSKVLSNSNYVWIHFWRLLNLFQPDNFVWAKPFAC